VKWIFDININLNAFLFDESAAQFVSGREQGVVENQADFRGIAAEEVRIEETCDINNGRTFPGGRNPIVARSKIDSAIGTDTSIYNHTFVLQRQTDSNAVDF